DGNDTDLCLEGTKFCSAQGVMLCNEISSSTVDVCNGIDDDCDPSSADGSEDQFVGTACDGPDSDHCAEGIYQCTNGALVCTDQTIGSLDLCNGLDDDCDAASADGSEDPRVGAPCDGPDADFCDEGVYSCSGGSLACSDHTGATLEICGNGVDDDCDGDIDEGC
ncbi:MAG TPA: MopE-related protein, partial [Candidatus Polarisedimenticolia bacterium]|nr:MopE-related protein [Candidatus Polarisedimenticolia bacterium]